MVMQIILVPRATRLNLFKRNDWVKGREWFPGDSPYDGLYREAPPRKGYFFRRQVYERVRNTVMILDREKTQKE